MGVTGVMGVILLMVSQAGEILYWDYSKGDSDICMVKRDSTEFAQVKISFSFI